MNNKKILVVGASGFVGGAAIARLAQTGGQVIGLSRRRPAALPPSVAHIAADLLDDAQCREIAAALADVTQVIYAAVNETPGDLVASWTDPQHAERNGRMFRNLLDIALAKNGVLQQIVLVHGTKAYGAHLPGRPAVPLRESLPRPPHDDFYFRQEDYLWQRQREAQWSWSIFRAPAIVGGGLGSNLNGLLAIAVFACLRRAAGLSLPFPGSADNLGVMEMVDVDLLVRALDWSIGTPAARNQIFNIANGDVYVWPDMWAQIADEIGIPFSAAVEPQSIVAAIAAQAKAWARLVERHRLSAPADWRQFLGESAALADFQLNYCGRSVLTSTIKIRQAGFHDCIDSAASVRNWIRRWREEKLLPPR